MITIYQGPIQEDCETPEEMEEVIRDTVVHEVGHYFGLDDDRLRSSRRRRMPTDAKPTATPWGCRPARRLDPEPGLSRPY